MAGVLLVGVLLQTDNTNVKDNSVCQQAGIEECWMFTLDVSALEKMKVDDEIKFTDKDDFKVKLRQTPTLGASSNYQFHTTDGQEASLQVRTLPEGGVSIYGSAHTNQRIYSIESLGNGNNVLFWRKADYFNNMID